ncbi:MAG: response regulator [Lachnospiraceae bacterium]|nr:response regulator [Lachnospiraceae bacterium]
MLMGYSVMLIRSERTFMINALKINLEQADYRVQEVDFNVKEIGAIKDMADLMILYADDDIRKEHGALVYLKDLCLEEDKLLILIGSKQEIEDISAYIPPHLLADVVERPLDMNFFIDKINTLMDEEQIEQRKKCILLVDDDVSCLQLLREWLREDYRIGMARSGMQAITWLARNNVDLILLDYEMPVTSGDQVFKMLKSEQYSKNIPVMFLTGKSDKDSIMKVMALKPAGYMLKTISRKNLLATLDKFFVEQKYKSEK